MADGFFFWFVFILFYFYDKADGSYLSSLLLLVVGHYFFIFGERSYNYLCFLNKVVIMVEPGGSHHLSSVCAFKYFDQFNWLLLFFCLSSLIDCSFTFLDDFSISLLPPTFQFINYWSIVFHLPCSTHFAIFIFSLNYPFSLPNFDLGLRVESSNYFCYTLLSRRSKD